MSDECQEGSTKEKEEHYNSTEEEH